MTILQGLQVKQSTIRESINTLLGNDSRTEEQDGELVKLTADGTAIEPEIRAAIVASHPTRKKPSWRVTRKPARACTVDRKGERGRHFERHIREAPDQRRSGRATKALRHRLAPNTS